MKFIRASEEAFYAHGDPLIITEEDIEMLKREVHNTKRKRIRICTHDGDRTKLQEMFVCYTRETIVATHKHVDKDESFYVREGMLEFNLHDDANRVVGVSPMGQGDYIRVPMNRWHSIKLLSDFCVLHVTTTGPFSRADTVWHA